MKTIHLDTEEPQLGRKPKGPRVNHQLVSKVGKAIYHIDNVKEVSIKIKLKGGTAISFYRSEDEDRLNRMKEKYDKDEEEDDDND